MLAARICALSGVVLLGVGLTAIPAAGVPMTAKDFYDQGEVYLARAKYDLAIAFFNEALALDRQFARAYLSRGLAYTGKGERDRAEADFKTALALDPALAALKQERIAHYGPVTEPPLRGESGKVRLVNAYSLPVTILVNGRKFDLQPGDTTTLTVAAGDFSYEVMGIRPLVTRTVKPGETFTVRVHP